MSAAAMMMTTCSPSAAVRPKARLSASSSPSAAAQRGLTTTTNGRRDVSVSVSLSRPRFRSSVATANSIVVRASAAGDDSAAPSPSLSAPPVDSAAGAPSPGVGAGKASKKGDKKSAKAAKSPPPLQKPKRRKAKTGEKKVEVPPTAAEIAASEKYDAMLAEGGIVYEVFIRAKGPNQWFPVGPMAVKQDWMIVPEMWNAEEAMKKAGFKMYPALMRAPCFGKVEYGYRERDDSKKVTEEEIRAQQGKLNPFEDVILLERPADGVGGPPQETFMDKLNKFMNPYGTGK